jgi:hypothetical protein
MDKTRDLFFLFWGGISGIFEKCKDLHASKVFIKVWLRKKEKIRPIQLQD